LSLTTVGTPHRGSALADFAKLRVGRVYRLLRSIGIDPSGCLDVTRLAARRFHRQNGEVRGVPCFSVAGVPADGSVCWPLRRVHAVLAELEGPNDGLVSEASAISFGTPLSAWPLDHLQQLNWMVPGVVDHESSPTVSLYQGILRHLAAAGFGEVVAAGALSQAESEVSQLPSCVDASLRVN
jgi:triacylglycerol lipase